ncbi:terminase family protein [Pseudoalteromonas sp. GABNS16G]|uniref:terminase large subunit domain-containing protein n=1 Tax=Pseudoalteromonas sp. GABNS16G TaxID=3025324 RepID=UPI0023582AE3|nr:terminase family protein [Pseudoalteromonas sp. GABNS16G]MDC9602919.1 terminase family protein [Pseudoalteromonas sp. GABNS16G]
MKLKDKPQLPKFEDVFRPSPLQYKIYIATLQYRNTYLVCGRRFGKSTLAVRKLFLAALNHTNKEKKVGDFWFVSCTIAQAKSIAWQELVNLCEPYLITKKDEKKFGAAVHISERRIRIYNTSGGVSEIYVTGANNPNALRGKKIDYLVMDEASWIEYETYINILSPMLADTEGGSLVCTTPDAYAQWIKDKLDLGMSGSDPELIAFSYTTRQGGRVSEQELEKKRKEMSPRNFRQEFEAIFEKPIGQVYSEYESAVNARTDLLTPDKTNVLYIGMDFNINPLCAVVGTLDTNNNHIHVIDEIELKDAYTVNMCEEIRRRYPDHEIHIYPDASCASRKTNSVKTDYDVLQDHKYNFYVHIEEQNPEIRHRVEHVNKLLSSVYKNPELFIHSQNCAGLISCINGQVFDVNGKPKKAKSGQQGYDHFNDALGYLCLGLMPAKHLHVYINMPDEF